MNIEYLTPIKTGPFEITYELHNKLPIKILELSLEDYLYAVDSITFFSNGNYYRFESEELKLYLSNNFYPYPDSNFYRKFKIKNLKKILNFNFIFGKNLNIKIKYFNKNISNINLVYEEVTYLPKYSINFNSGINWDGEIVTAQYAIDDCNTKLIGMEFNIINKDIEFIEKIKFIFKNNISITIDMWDCQYLDSFYEENIDTFRVLIPISDKFFDILYCIENNLDNEIEEMLKQHTIDKNKAQLINLNNIFRNENIWGGYIDDIIINGNEKIKDCIIVQGMYLNTIEEDEDY